MLNALLPVAAIFFTITLVGTLLVAANDLIAGYLHERQSRSQPERRRFTAVKQSRQGNTPMMDVVWPPLRG